MEEQHPDSSNLARANSVRSMTSVSADIPISSNRDYAEKGERRAFIRRSPQGLSTRWPPGQCAGRELLDLELDPPNRVERNPGECGSGPVCQGRIGSCPTEWCKSIGLVMALQGA